MPAQAMVPASPMTAPPGPTVTASPDVATAPRPASPFCPADPSALIRPRSASGMARWIMAAANATIPALAPAKAMPIIKAPCPAAENMDRPKPASKAAIPGAIRSRP